MNPQRPWHTLNPEQALAALESDASRGLSEAEAAARRARFGENALPPPPRRSIAVVFLRQFASPLIYLLLAAAVLAVAMGEIGDGVVILVVVLLNSVIGAIQEGRAERSLEALRKHASFRAHVVREGREEVVEARELVPGDLLLVTAGDAITADARLVSSAALRTEEAALTGESAPVDKTPTPVAADSGLGDRRCMVYAGTLATAGRGRAVVVATGLAAEIGRIAALAEAGGATKTPLERRVAEFGRWVILLAVILFVAVVVVGIARDVPLGEIVMIAVSQTVGLVPEGLPVAMTVALAVGVQRMARRGAIVRRLAAVETLGSTTVICTDKTGTLTRNEMAVTALHLPGAREIDVASAGYAPSAAFSERGHPVEPRADADLEALLRAAVLCNDAQLRRPDPEDPRWGIVGDPTEGALVVLAASGGVDPDALRAAEPRTAEIPFDPDARFMATEHRIDGRTRIFVKGAPEVVFEMCARVRRRGASAAFDPPARAEASAAAERMASRALRVLALAEIEGATLPGADAQAFGALRGTATLLGLAGEIDPPRTEVKESVAVCRAAGIRPVMVTGDHKATAEAIARALGISAGTGGEVIDGSELARLSDAELASRAGTTSVFARVHPDQKLRIVQALQRSGEVVAMTGDGANDAPALSRADVGVAMGITGTDVAKESAEIVITDDDFATIVAAVEEGRVVYRNIKKAILLLVSTSGAEVAVLLLAMILGYPPPFVAVQILWNNLVTEGVITINLIMEPAEGDEMRGPPVQPGERLLSRPLLARMALMMPTLVVCSLGWFVVRTSQGIPLLQVRAETFTLLAVCEWFNVLNCRSETHSALTLGLLRNRWLAAGLLAAVALQAAVVFVRPLGRFFYTVPLTAPQVGAILLVGSLVLWVEEIRKLLARRHRPARQLRELRAS